MSHNCENLKRMVDMGVTWLECQECGAQWDCMPISMPSKCSQCGTPVTPNGYPMCGPCFRELQAAEAAMGC